MFQVITDQRGKMAPIKNIDERGNTVAAPTNWMNETAPMLRATAPTPRKNASVRRRDDGLGEEEARRAEERVASWRAQGVLPFPHFPESVREQLEDSLEWPPPGSPEGPPVRGDGAS